VRRQAQVRHRRPDLELIEIRGNVETRLRRMDEHGLDGLILAQAGLERLGLDRAITEILDPEWMLPAVGQGALGLECRSDDLESLQLLALLDDLGTRQAVTAERAFLHALGGGCVVPIGARARPGDEGLHLRGVVLSADGVRRIQGEAHGMNHQAQELGQNLALRLIDQGARELL
jgi:hydroxymethylbilane synthase